MNKNPKTKSSKFLSLILRHEPEKIGITLDSAGWVDVNVLLDAMKEHQHSLTLNELKEIVATSDKKRFAFNETGTQIRANQGHSVEVELGYEPQIPPTVLYHGTADRFVSSIREQGLIKGDRHHVHLSVDIETTMKVAMRRGRPILLTIRSSQMHADGMLFYLTTNGVWLTDHVPAKYIEFPQ